MLAICCTIEAFKNIILGSKVFIYSDNRNLSFNPAETNNIAQCWKLTLSELDYEIRHITGNQNQAADFLSRCSETKNLGELYRKELLDYMKSKMETKL